MKGFLTLVSASIVTTAAFAASGSAGVFTQWNFNVSPASSANIGTGTISTIGQASNSPFVNSGGGASNDPAYPTTANIWLGWNGSQPTDANGANSIRFSSSTVGKTGLMLSWDQQIGYRASRYFQLQVTTNGGATWSPVAGGTGSGSLAPANLGQGTASATVDNSGLITIVTKDNANANLSGGQTGITAAQSTANFNIGLSYTLPAGPWENNPLFGIEITAIHNPFQSSSTAPDYGYVSSFNGTNSTDTTLGYIRSAGSGGGDRFDMVTLSNVPEPTSLAAISAIGVAALRRNRRGN